MKILFITSSLDPKDGWGRYSNGLVVNMAKSHEVLVLVHNLHQLEDIKQDALLHSPHSVVSPFKLFFSRSKIQNAINQFNPDIIHFLVEPYVLVLPFLNIKPNTKTFLTVHGTYSFIPYLFLKERIKYWISGFLTKLAYKKLTGIISVSSFTKKHLLDKYQDFYKKNFDSNKIVVISNGIDLGSFPSNINQKPSNEKKVILFVGAVKLRKGILESLVALAEYKKKYGDNFVFVIVGAYKSEDMYVKQVMLKIQELNMVENTHFKGHVSESDLRSLYQNSDLLLVLSIQDRLSFEGFGLVYLEANIYGVPVIGSKNSGASDAILEAVTGYLVDPFDSIEIAEKVNFILNNGSIKPEDCLAWAKKQDIKEKAKQILSLYNNI